MNISLRIIAVVWLLCFCTKGKRRYSRLGYIDVLQIVGREKKTILWYKRWGCAVSLICCKEANILLLKEKVIYEALANKVDIDIVSFIAFAENLINIRDRQIYTIWNLKDNINLPYTDGFFKNKPHKNPKKIATDIKKYYWIAAKKYNVCNYWLETSNI